MIFRRTVANLRAQNWTAIVIEIGIVIVGVFIGTQVSNWNQLRLDRNAASKMLVELRPGLENLNDFYETARPYYSITRRYADVAFAGWRGDPSVSDEQFVIGAYQASQAYTLGLNAVNWTQVFGGDQLDNVDDPALKQDLANLMTLNFGMIDEDAVYTPYREHVRQIIPEDIQDAIRAQCGDQPIPDKPLTQQLPARCDLDFPAERWMTAARRLRATPVLADELRWHRAAVATFLSNMELFETQTQQVLRRLDERPD